VGQSKQGIHWRRRANRKLSIAWIKAMKVVFARCSKKIVVQVCTNYNNVFLFV
jgi:hypothetical protein